MSTSHLRMYGSGIGQSTYDYVVNTKDELDQVLSNCRDGATIALGRDILFTSTISIPQKKNIYIDGLNHSIIRDFNCGDVFYCSNATSGWTFRNIVWRPLGGWFTKLNDTTAHLDTSDRLFTSGELVNGYFTAVGSDGNVSFISQIVSNTSDQVVVQDTINSGLYYYYIVPKNENNFIHCTARFANTTMDSCTVYGITNGNFVELPTGDNTSGWYVSNNKFITRPYPNLFYGSFINTVFKNNYHITSITNHNDLFMVEWYYNLYGGWCNYVDVVYNSFYCVGTPNTGGAVRYADTSGSGAFVKVYGNYFSINQGNNRYYIVDLYDTTAGYNRRARIIRENYYWFGGGPGFFRDYQDNGHLTGDVGDNYQEN